MRGRLPLFLTIALLMSCSAKGGEGVIYISTPCKVEMPKRPIYRNDTILNLYEVLKYAELLEETMKICRGD